MRFRYLLLIFVVVFAATLAVIVGEQLTSEAMSVMVGVVAGVGASIPTSLLIIWLAVRTAELRAVPAAPAPNHYPLEAPEPRIVVVTQRAEPEARAADPYAVAAYAGDAPFGGAGETQARRLPAPTRPRQFTVIGGAADAEADGLILSEPQYQEVAWQR